MPAPSPRVRPGLAIVGPALLVLASACVSPPTPVPAPHLDPLQPIERLLADAALRQREGDLESSRRDFSEALRQCRSLDDPHLRRQMLSRCYLARGDWYVRQSLLEAARLDYERTLAGAAETTRRETLARLILVTQLLGEADAADRLRVYLGDDHDETLDRLRSTLFATHLAAVEPPVSEPPDGATVHPRAEWHAAPLRPRQANMMAPIYRLTVHHTGSRVDGPLTESQAAATIRSIQTAHFQRGWADIGYHFLIDSSGRVWEGRPLRWQGAHAGNPDLNSGNIGISLMGNFQDQEVSAAQRRSLARLVRDLCRRYGIDSAHIYTHRELRSTLCPGSHLQAFVDRLRTEIAAVARSDSSEPTATPSLSR